MRSISAPAQAEALKWGVNTRALVTIDFAGGLTLRVSDQSIVDAPDGNSYLGLLVGLPEVDGGFDDITKVNEPRELSLNFANARSVEGFDRFSDLLITYPIAFATVTIKWWLKGADAEADLITEFVGEAEGPTSITVDSVTVQVSGIEFSQRTLLPLYKINVDDFPSAADVALGRVVGPVIGSVKGIPIWPVDVGERDTLREYITSLETSILKLSDASAFPSSGTVLISSEEITYAGKSGNDLTTLTRGVGGSTASFHNRGAAVQEKKSEYVYLGPTFPMENVSAVKVAGVLAGAGEYALNLIDTALLPGYTVVSVKFNVPAIIEQHQHESAEVTDQEKPVSTSGHAGWVNKANAIDGSSDDWSTFSEGSRATIGLLPTNPTVYANFNLYNWTGLADAGEIIAATYHCNFKYEELNWISGKNDGWIDGIQIQHIGGWGNRVLTWGGPLSWSALDRTVTIKIHPDMGKGFYIYDLWLTIIYVTTTPGAPAGADAAVRIPITLDGDGVYDLSECTTLTDGEITGADRTLIERPDHVIEFIQRVLAERPVSQLDSSSYAASGAVYDESSKGWVMAGFLNREWSAAELLARMAAEALSDQFWEGGVHKLVYDDPDPTADVTIEDSDLAGNEKLSFTERDSVANIVEVHFSRNYDTELSSDRQEAFNGIARAQGATPSASIYGEQAIVFEVEFVRVQAHADDIAQRMIDKLEEQRWVVQLPLVWTKAAALERGDIIDPDLGLFSEFSAPPLVKIISMARSFQGEVWEVTALEVK